MSAEWPFYLTTLLLAFLLSDMWRWGAVLLSLSFKEDDEIVILARMVATAVLAGVVARLLFLPPAELAQIPLWVRIAAMMIGMGAFVWRGKSIFSAILAGQGALITLGLLSGSVLP
jgi:hypothetical protein